MALPLFGAYNASKHALEGLSDSMRYDLAAQGVAVVIIKPGECMRCHDRLLSCGFKIGRCALSLVG